MSSIEFIKGDAFEEISDLPSNSAHCAVVDYPWEFDIKNGTDRFGFNSEVDGVSDEVRDGSREIYRMESDERVGEILNKVSRVLIDGSWVIFFSDDRFQDTVRQEMKDNSRLVFRRNWAWKPGQIGMGIYGRVNHYPIPVATVGETDRKVRDRGTLFEVAGGRNTQYPTGKPISLYRKLLKEPVIRESETLIEPFCGSAPGAYIAKQRGLDYWGCDINSVAFEKRESQTGRSLLDLC